MTGTLPPDLAALGDELQRAVQRDLALPRRSRHRRRIAIAAAVAVAGIGGGAAAASGLFGSDDVEKSLPASLAYLVGHQPVCEPVAGTTDTFSCHIDGGVREGEYAQMDFDDFATNINNAAGYVVGGCRGQDSDGVGWLCYVGQKAVDKKIISQDFLGEYAPGPGVG
jgi:hypothetical protein